MGNVGLLYSAAVLIVNGLVLLGVVSGRAAAPINLFVGGMQVIIPTLVLIQADGDPAVILGASSAYLFGFTYLYIGVNELIGASGEGLGWYSLFVTASALGYSAHSLISGSLVYGVLWFFWGLLWVLYFLMLARHKTSIEPMSGWFTLFIGVFTVAIPGFLELVGIFPNTVGVALLTLVICIALFVLSWILGRLGKLTASSPASTPAEVTTEKDAART